LLKTYSPLLTTAALFAAAADENELKIGNCKKEIMGTCFWKNHMQITEIDSEP
jgi:hypothetical protein